VNSWYTQCVCVVVWLCDCVWVCGCVGVWVCGCVGVSSLLSLPLYLQAATDQMKRIYHYLDHPRELDEACPHSVEGLKGHILLLGYVTPTSSMLWCVMLYLLFPLKFSTISGISLGYLPHSQFPLRVIMVAFCRVCYVLCPSYVYTPVLTMCNRFSADSNVMVCFSRFENILMLCFTFTGKHRRILLSWRPFDANMLTSRLPS
jgi:hypothetical protein